MADRKVVVRNNDLAAIHIRKKELQLDEGQYRDLMQTVTGKRSSAELDHVGRRQFLEHLDNLAAAMKVETTKRKRTGMPRPAPGRDDALRSKINAHLLDRGLTRAYLEKSNNGRPSMLRRLADVDAIEFATEAGLLKVVAALAIDQRRHR